MVFSRYKYIILKINIKGMKYHDRGYKSTRGEEERGPKGLTNNPKIPNFPKPHNIYLFIVCLIEDSNHQSLNVGGAYYVSLPSIVVREMRLSTSLEECKRFYLHKDLILLYI
jgi:hypothetical protein